MSTYIADDAGGALTTFVTRDALLADMAKQQQSASTVGKQKRFSGKGSYREFGRSDPLAFYFVFS